MLPTQYGYSPNYNSCNSFLFAALVGWVTTVSMLRRGRDALKLPMENIPCSSICGLFFICLQGV